MANYSLNAFDQYQQLENRLTRALGVTLERSPAFRQAFLRKFARGARLGRTCPFRKSYPDVLMVQSSQHRNGENGARSLDCSINRRILL
jgi:hypothetical protein